MSDTKRVGIMKLGAIGAAPLLDLLLDERAERKDIEIRTITSGATLDEEPCIEVATKMTEFNPDFVVVVSPNAALKGPSKAREIILEKGIPLVAISDNPSKKAFYEKNEKGKSVPVAPEGSGFIVLPMDPMIGARKEFLDPTEMALFNAELIKLLASTGVLRYIQLELEKIIEAIKAGKKPELPKVTLKTENALETAGFENPYAYAKAYAALKMVEVVADVTTTACFKEQDPDKYVPMAAAAHEILRAATRLADDAREIEKGNNTVLRTSHSSSGKILRKTELLEKPE